MKSSAEIAASWWIQLLGLKVWTPSGPIKWGVKQGHAAVSGAGRFGSWLAAISVSVKQSWHGCPHISFTVAAPHPAVNPIPPQPMPHVAAT